MSSPCYDDTEIFRSIWIDKEAVMLEPVFPDSKSFNCQDLYLLTVGTEAGKEIYETCHEIAHMLVKKNIAYGNSALDPVRIFSKAGPREQLHVRIDDKLNRLMKAQNIQEIMISMT